MRSCPILPWREKKPLKKRFQNPAGSLAAGRCRNSLHRERSISLIVCGTSEAQRQSIERFSRKSQGSIRASCIWQRRDIRAWESSSATLQSPQRCGGRANDRPRGRKTVRIACSASSTFTCRFCMAKARMPFVDCKKKSQSDLRISPFSPGKQMQTLQGTPGCCVLAIQAHRCHG